MKFLNGDIKCGQSFLASPKKGPDIRLFCIAKRSNLFLYRLLCLILTLHMLTLCYRECVMLIMQVVSGFSNKYHG